MHEMIQIFGLQNVALDGFLFILYPKLETRMGCINDIGSLL